MNGEVRAAVDARLKDQRMSRADPAHALGKTPQTVTRALNGTEGCGTVPPLWAAILGALDPELTAQPRTPGEGRTRDR